MADVGLYRTNSTARRLYNRQQRSDNALTCYENISGDGFTEFCRLYIMSCALYPRTKITLMIVCVGINSRSFKNYLRQTTAQKYLLNVQLKALPALL